MNETQRKKTWKRFIEDFCEAGDVTDSHMKKLNNETIADLAKRTYGWTDKGWDFRQQLPIVVDNNPERIYKVHVRGPYNPKNPNEELWSGSTKEGAIEISLPVDEMGTSQMALTEYKLAKRLVQKGYTVYIPTQSQILRMFER